jgi:hypothetical protein
MAKENDKIDTKPIAGKAVQLITQQNGKLKLNDESAQLIKNLKGNIGVISVIGPYRSGKSYIMNRLLNRSDGFELGCTYSSTTRGIWMWNNMISHVNENGDQMNLIVLDTEV